MAFDPTNPTGGPAIEGPFVEEEEEAFDPTNPTGSPAIGGPVKEEEAPFPLLERSGSYLADQSQFFRNVVSSRSLLDQGVHLNDGNVTQGMVDAFGLSAKDAAMVYETAIAKGVPEDVVFANKDEEAAWKRAADFSARLFGSDPETGKPIFPYAAAHIAKGRLQAASVMGDQEAILKLDAEIREMGLELGKDIAGMSVRFNGSKAEVAFAKVANTAKGLARGILRKAELVQALGVSQLRDVFIPTGEDRLTDVLRGLRKSELLEDFHMPYTTFKEEYATDAIGALPQAGTLYLGQLLGTLVMGAYVSNATDEEAEALGVDDAQRRIFAGLANEAWQFLPDYFTRGLVGKLGRLARSPLAVGKKAVELEAAKFVLAVVGNETTDAYPEYTSLQYALAIKDGTTRGERWDNFWRDFAETSLKGVKEGLTLLPSALGGGASSVAHIIRRNGMLTVLSERWKNVTDISAKSNMRKDSPEQFVEFMDGAMEEEGVDPNVYLSHEDLLQAADNDRDEVDRIAEELGVADQMEAAEILGVDLTISKGRAAQVFSGSEIGLRTHNATRFSRDGITLNERAEDKVTEESLRKELADHWETLKKDNKVPAAVIALREDLMKAKKKGGAGVSAANADAVIVAWLAGGKTLSKVAGETTEAWFDRTIVKTGGKGVVAEGVEELLKQQAEPVEAGKRPWDMTDAEWKEGGWTEFPGGEDQKLLLPSEYKQVAKNEGERARDLVYELNLGGVDTLDTHRTDNAFVIHIPPDQLDVARGFIAKYGPSLRTEKIGHYLSVPLEVKPATLQQAEDEIVRGAFVPLENGQRIVHIFDSANLSTFLHEMAHVFTDDMKRIIDSGLGDEQFRADYQTLIDFADGKLDKAGLEKIADAFENYLNEGKAPSIGLMAAFAKFSKWMKNIYRNLRVIKGVEINDEVRAVFDRLLATEEEIKDAQAVYAGGESLEDHLKLTQKQKAKLKRKKDRVAPSAEEVLNKRVAKLLKSWIRDPRQGGLKGIKQTATEEVDAEPVNKVRVSIAEKGGLDAKSVKELYGKEKYKALQGKKLVKKKGKATIAEQAIEQGYESEEALIADLIEAESRREAIDTRTKEALAQAEENIRFSLGKQSELTAGEEAYHTEARLEFLIAEANLLMEEIEKQESPEAQEAKIERMVARVIRNVATKALGEMRTDQAARPDRFALAELKFGRQYDRLLSAGDLVGAHQARQMQLLHHVMVQQAIKLRDETEKVVKGYKQRAFNAKLKGTDNASMVIATDAAYAFGLSDAKPRVIHDVLDFEGVDKGLSSGVADWIKAKTKPKDSKRREDNWKALTMNEFLDLHDAIEGVIEVGRDKWRGVQDERHKSPDAASAASVETQSKLGTKKYRKDKFWDRWIKGPLQTLAVMGTQVEAMLDRADGHSLKLTKLPGTMVRLFRRVVDQETYNNDEKTRIMDAVGPHFQTIYDGKKRIESVRGKFFPIEGVRNLNVEGWTVNEALTVLAYMGNEKSYNALINGWGLTAGELYLIAGIFEKGEMLAVQQIWDATDTIFPALDKVEMDLYSRHLIKEEAQSITLTDANGEGVTLDGGYFPMSQFDHTKSDRAADIKEKHAANDRGAAVHHVSRTQDSARHARVARHNLPPLLDIKVWTTHISDVTRVVSHSEVMRDFDRVTLNPEWRKMFTEKFGEEGYNQVRKWAQHQAKPELKSKLPSWLENQRRLSVVAALAYNIKTGIQQRFSFTHGVRKIGLKWVMEGYAQTDLLTSTLGIAGDSYEELLKMDPYMRLRATTVYRLLNDITQEMDPFAKSFEIGGKKFTAKNIQQAGFYFLLMNDRAVVEPLYRGAYSQFVSELATDDMTPDQIHKGAMDYAGGVIREGQPGSAVFDQNHFQRGEGWLRLVTTFMSYTSRFGSMLTTHHDAFWVDGVMSNEQYIKHLFYDVLLNRYLVTMLTAALTTGELPEWWELFVSPVEGLSSWVPVGRDLTRAARYGFRDAIGNTPVFEGVNRGVEAWSSLSDWALDDGQFSSFLWDVGKATEFQLGVKPLGVIEDLDKKYKALTGRKK